MFFKVEAAMDKRRWCYIVEEEIYAAEYSLRPLDARRKGDNVTVSTTGFATVFLGLPGGQKETKQIWPVGAKFGE